MITATSRALVIVPTYNEAGSVVEMAHRLFAAVDASVDLLVVDDGSPDGTARVVQSLAEDNPRIHLLERPGKAGLGTAYIQGFKWGLDRGYEALVEMDADLSHDPADVPRLLEMLDDADLVIGSRYVPGGSIPSWGAFRRALSASGNIYARMWLGHKVRDSTSGFRAYRADTLRGQDLSSVRSEGYAFQIEMTRRVHKAGGRIVEIPIAFTDRTVGSSKMSRRIAIEALQRVTAWGISDRFGAGRRERRRAR